MSFLITFVVTMLVNFGITIFGKQNIANLRQKMSIGTYIKDMQRALEEEIGDRAVTTIKLVLVAILVLFVVFNLVGTFLFIMAVVLGTIAAKKSYAIGAVANVVNKISTYIHRLM